MVVIMCTVSKYKLALARLSPKVCLKIKNFENCFLSCSNLFFEVSIWWPLEELQAKAPHVCLLSSGWVC